jgi:hypothetical protein
MNQVLALVRASRSPFDTADTLHSETMLAELLVLHEEILAQLQLERLGSTEAPEFLFGMIEQHERVAAGIRLQLEALRARDAMERELRD